MINYLADKEDGLAVLLNLKEERADHMSILETSLFREIVVDNFAGGGGASTGIEKATGLNVDIAINHDPEAIRMHKTNHPDTEHYCESVWDVDPKKAVRGRKVGLCWLSPDCTHHSRAKGGKPVSNTLRGLAWIALKWGGSVRPRVIMLENVVEFEGWGPLTDEGKPDPKRKGETFKSYIGELERLGYEVEWKHLSACDYGAPTSRTRFFLIARCDGKPIVWPKPTHAPVEEINKKNLLQPYRTAGSIIDWSIPAPSIYKRKKPLSENTVERLRRGIKKFVVENEKPYIVGGNAFFLTHYYSTIADETRGGTMDQPIHTIPTANRFGLVCAFLTKYYGSDTGQSLHAPLHTVTTKDRFGLVIVKGTPYKIYDVGLRMLQPRELFNGQGFPKDYIIDVDYEGKKYSKKEQVARCGNAVPPAFSFALTQANLPDLCAYAQPIVS